MCSRINDIGCGPVGNAQQVFSEGGGGKQDVMGGRGGMESLAL